MFKLFLQSYIDRREDRRFVAGVKEADVTWIGILNPASIQITTMC